MEEDIKVRLLEKLLVQELWAFFRAFWEQQNFENAPSRQNFDKFRKIIVIFQKCEISSEILILIYQNILVELQFRVWR